MDKSSLRDLIDKAKEMTAASIQKLNEVEDSIAKQPWNNVNLEDISLDDK